MKRKSNAFNCTRSPLPFDLNNTLDERSSFGLKGLFKQAFILLRNATHVNYSFNWWISNLVTMIYYMGYRRKQELEFVKVCPDLVRISWFVHTPPLKKISMYFLSSGHTKKGAQFTAMLEISWWHSPTILDVFLLYSRLFLTKKNLIKSGRNLSNVCCILAFNGRHIPACLISSTGSCWFIGV